MKRLLKTLCLIALTVKVVAQPGTIDTTFNPFDVGYASGDGFANGYVYSIIVQDDDKILVGGSFNNYKGQSSCGIIRLYPNGSRDTSFEIGTGFSSSVYCLALQPDNKILVGGHLYSYNGFACKGIIRLKPNGRRDTSFQTGTGFNGNVECIAIQADGKIIIGGSITSYNGSDCYGIVRLHTDGILDTSFNVGTGVDGWISSITIQPDGKIIAGGGFSSYNGSTCNNIVRLDTDGIIDTSFNVGNGFNSTVRSLISQPDGKIVAVGDYSSFNGNPCNGLVRLNTDGSKDTSFNADPGIINPKSCILSNNKIILSTGWNMALLSSDGTIDNSFNIGTGFNQPIHAMAIQTDGKILSGGEFSFCNDTACASMTRLNENGSLDTSFNKNSGFNEVARCILNQPDGKIIVGGDFTSYYDFRCGPIIRLLNDGSRDTTFNSANVFSWGHVEAFALQPDGKIVVGGSFITVGGNQCRSLARLNLDGSLDSSFQPGYGFGINGTVYTIVIQPNGKILVGGNFYEWTWTDCNNIVRLNIGGDVDTTFDSGIGFDYPVKMIRIQSDGKIIVGGFFTSFNGNSCNSIVRLNMDGSRDYSFEIGSGFDYNVHSLAILPSEKILVGGIFHSYNGISTHGLVCLNPDGSIDTGFNTGSGFEHQDGDIEWSLAVQPDSKVIVSGLFTSYNGTPCNYLVRLEPDGSIDHSFATGAGLGFLPRYEKASAIQLQLDGKLLVCGSFISYNNKGRNRIARIHTSCQSFITPEITIEISHPSNPVCEGETVTFEATTINEGAAPGYQWKVNGINAGTNSPTFVIPTLENGDVVTCEMTTIETCVTEDTVTSNSITMTITPVPQTPTISLAGNVLSSNAPTGNQWYNQNGIIIGASSQQYSVSVNGDYYNIVTVAGCSSDTSNIINITGIGVETIGSSEELSVYPNPTTNELIIEFEGNPTEISFELANTFGQIVLEGRLVEKAIICTQELAPGVYMLILKNDKEIDRIKVIKN